MKTTTWIGLIALGMIMLFSSCDRGLSKNGSGVVTTTSRSIQYFERIEVDGSYDLHLHNSDLNYVTVTTDDNLTSSVQTFVQDGELYIEMSDDYHNYDFTCMEVHVYGHGYAYLDLNGSVNTIVEDTLALDVVELRQNGSGNVRLTFNGNQLIAVIRGSGHIETNGNTEFLKYEIDGSGKIDGLDLIAHDAVVSIEGSGDVFVHATSTLNVEIDGSGDIRYLGSPSITSRINGSGSISAY